MSILFYDDSTLSWRMGVGHFLTVLGPLPVENDSDTQNPPGKTGQPDFLGSIFNILLPFRQYRNDGNSAQTTTK